MSNSTVWQTLKKNYLSDVKKQNDTLTVVEATVYICLRIPIKVEIKHDANGNILSAKAPKYSYLSVYEPQNEIIRFFNEYVKEITNFRIPPENHKIFDYLQGEYNDGFTKRRFSFTSLKYFEQFILTAIELIKKLYIPIYALPPEILAIYPNELININLMEHEYVKKPKLNKRPGNI